ncbi:hypothetical protein lerEdw1_004453 [Lerista edwardsae]|nr:hypothetical protein lerEdw1_004453 [Lerista edwardsae]
MAIMLRSQIVLFVLMLGFLANWFEFLGVSIRKAGWDYLRNPYEGSAWTSSMAIMLRSQIVLFVLMLGFLGNWFEFLGVSIRNADSLPVECTLPAESGLCLANAERWYYDVGTGRCEFFTYGGCGGNANNFGTRKECKETCK